MRDHYTLHLSQHQVKGLHAALGMVNQLLAVPEGTPVYPNLPTEDVARPLVVSELKLLHEEILRQLKEQAYTSRTASSTVAPESERL